MNKEWIIENRYLVLEKIAVGGLAEVYKAWDLENEEFVAVKKIHEELSRDAQFVDMFRDEARNTAKLKHENIVRVINFIKSSRNDYYMIMELVRGIDLEYFIDKIRKSSLKIPLSMVLYIMTEVIKGLGYAHTAKDEQTGESLNIVHRDVTPGNIMLFYEGQIKLADFGVAKAGDESKKKTKKIVGKIAYMSPEQAHGQINMDGRSDLFSCGLVMYELLTLSKAFYGDSATVVLQKVKNAEVDFKKLKDVGVSPEMQRILKQTLQKNPDKRFKDATEMFIELKRFASLIAGTEKLKEQYKEFIGNTLRDEIKTGISEIVRDSKRDFHALAKKARASEVKEQPVSVDIEKGKTVLASVPETVKKKKRKSVSAPLINFAEKNKKLFVFTVFMSVFGAMLFTAMDTYYQFTSLGKRINSYIWPATLQLDTIPSGARIELLRDNVDIIESQGYEDTTPLNIKNIQPGTYTLKLSKPNFREIVRKVNVLSDKGEIKITVAGSRIIDGIFFVPFEVLIEINSDPDNAELFIDNKKVGKTPYRGVLGIGKHNILLTREGYKPLGNKNRDIQYYEYLPGICMLDTSKAADEQINVDPSFWDLQQEDIPDQGSKYILTGFLENKED